MAQVEMKVPFEGKEFKLQNMTLIIPPLNFAALKKGGGIKKLKKVFKGFKDMVSQLSDDNVEISDDVFDDAVDLIYMAAVRNYPEITREQIEDGLDLGNVMGIIPMLMNQNPIEEISKNAEEQ